MPTSLACVCVRVRGGKGRRVRIAEERCRLLEETASELQQVEGRVRDETEAQLRAKLGEDAYAAVYEERRALALEDALALALRPN